MNRCVHRMLSLALSAGLALSLMACGNSGASDVNKSSQGGTAASKTGDTSASNVSDAADKAFKASGKTLNVGVQSNVISVPVVYAQDRGYFKEAGLDVNLIVFPNGAPENEGLAAEQLDVASNGLASVYSMASGLCDWIGETDTGSATLGIYIKEDSPVFGQKGILDGKPDMYGSANTLKGLTMLGPTSTIEQWAASAYFSQFGLESGKDYNYLNMDRAAAAQAVIGGQGDVFVASDVDYANMMKKAGFKQVANCQEATDTQFNNGYLVRKNILEERYDDIVMFLQVAYKAAAELQADCSLRNTFTLKYYNDNGKTSTLEDVEAETQLRPFILAEDMKKDGFIMGAGMLQVGRFFASIETIESEQVNTVEEAINTKPLEDALGFSIKGATLK